MWGGYLWTFGAPAGGAHAVQDESEKAVGLQPCGGGQAAWSELERGEELGGREKKTRSGLLGMEWGSDSERKRRKTK